MIKVLLSKKNKSLQVGDLIIEKSRVGCKKRIGEVVFIREGKMRKIQLIQLNNHDLSPVYNSDESRLKFFTLSLKDLSLSANMILKFKSKLSSSRI